MTVIMEDIRGIYVICDAGDPHIRHIHYSLEEPVVLKNNLQTVVIGHTVDYGPALFIGDDMEHLSIQSTLADEALYHRPFVHGAAALCNSAPRTALLIGGGEGSMARELLKYNTIEIIDQIDWDADLINYFKQPTVAALWNGSAYEDPRLRVHVEDAFTSRVWAERTYDLILMDLCDPDAETIGPLKDLVARLQGSLNAGGVFLMNVGPILPLLREFPGILKTPSYSEELLEHIKGLGGNVRHPFSFKLYVPSYNFPWCLVGLADGYTIGDWSRTLFGEDEMTDVLHYGPSYSENFRSTNKDFIKTRYKMKDVILYENHWGC